MICLPGALLDIARQDTWVEPVSNDRMLEHVIDWLNDPANDRHARDLLGPLLTRATRAVTDSDSPAR